MKQEKIGVVKKDENVFDLKVFDIDSMVLNNNVEMDLEVLKDVYNDKDIDVVFD